MTQQAFEPVSCRGGVDFAVRVRPSSVAATSAPPVDAGPGHTVSIDARLDAIDRWGTALAQHDDVEVDRLVRQSRADRVESATVGRFGTMLGQPDSSSLIGAVE